MRKIDGWLVFACLSLFVWLLSACQKTISEGEPATDNEVTSPGSTVTPRLSYGDTLFYLKNQPGNYTIRPVSKPAAPGYFRSIPLGLALDSVSGNINITQSETGIRYKIYYIGVNGNALDSVKLVVSGIDYTDAIYQIARTPNAYDTAFPIYNAIPSLALPCGDDDEDGDGDLDDDDNQCVFDETDLDDDGNDDIPGVIQDKLLVDIKKGTIDVEASFHAGIFGSSNPANGATKDFTFYYRLQDASNRALNKITVRVYHFETVSAIPQALLDTLNLRSQISAAVNSRMISGGSAGRDLQQGQGSKDSFGESLAYFDYYYRKPKRPPIIIIVSQ
jgi:hypothetical protein